MPKYSQVADADDDDDDDDDFASDQFYGAPATPPVASDNVVKNAILHSNSLMARKWAFPDAT